MLKGNLLYFLYVAAAGAVGVGGFYVVPKLVNPAGPGAPAIVESQPTDSGKSDRPKTEKPEAATEMAKVDSAASAPDTTAKPVVPGFDLLRVEPDGSTVIAGYGEPNSAVEVINGETVIATAETGPTGDFVAVLDEPLPAGDYQLRLRTVMPDGSKVISEDVATVSVPEDPAGQLLAMVGKPGEASRILTQPETKEVAEKPTEMASVEAERAPDAEPKTETEVIVETEVKTEPEAEVAAVVDENVQDTAKEVVLPPLPAGTSKIFGKAPDTAPASGPTSEIAAVDADTVKPELETTEPSVEPVGVPAIEQKIRVDAVEIEGDKIFVAGAATPGFKVRVLADGAEVGTATTDKDGRFIVESTHDLSVGSHEIAAELISPQSGEVVLRAVVPFVRPEGANMAAVANDAAPEEPVATTKSEQNPDQVAGTDAEPVANAAETANPTPGAAARTVEQAPLEPAAGSVIIRRGDTLWQISRRTYGQGVRYTTIYLANQQQIGNPDRISPGQVFRVPETPEPIADAQRIHKELLKGDKPASN